MSDGPDLSALTRRMRWSEVAAQRPGLWRDAAIGLGVLLAALAYILWYFFATKPELPTSLLPLSGFVGVAGGVGVVLGFFALMLGALLAFGPVEERRRYRVRLCAADNGLVYSSHGEPPPRVGMVFGVPGRTATIVHQLQSVSGTEVRGRTGPATVQITIANATLGSDDSGIPTSTGTRGRGNSGRRVTGRADRAGRLRGAASPQRSGCGYLHVALSAPAGHYILDATANNRRAPGRVGEGLLRSQRVSLEGDFDQHFTLYVPDGDERTALQLFTPDLMARLIDHGSAWDVEIIGRDLFVYSDRKLALHKPGIMGDLLGFVDGVVPALGGRVARMARPSAEAEPPTPSELRLRRRSDILLLALPIVAITTMLTLLVGTIID